MLLISWHHAGREGPQHRPEAPPQLSPGKGHRAPSLADAGSVGRRQRGRESDIRQRLLLKAPTLEAPRESEVTISQPAPSPLGKKGPQATGQTSLRREGEDWLRCGPGLLCPTHMLRDPRVLESGPHGSWPCCLPLGINGPPCRSWTS